MGELLHTFESTDSASYTTFWLALIGAAAGLLGMILLLRRTTVNRANRNTNIVLAMLLFFLFLIGGSTAFFSYLRLRAIGPVEIYAEGISTPYGAVSFQDIRNAKIIVDSEPALLSPSTGRKTRLLTIVERDGKTHALSEADYPVEEIMGKLKKTIEEQGG